MLMLAVTFPLAFHVFGAMHSEVSGLLFDLGLFLGAAVLEAYLALVYVEVARIRDAKPV